MFPTAQIKEIFYNPGHWMNEVLAERFGPVDEDGIRLYNVSLAEMREHVNTYFQENREELLNQYIEED